MMSGYECDKCVYGTEKDKMALYEVTLLAEKAITVDF